MYPFWALPARVNEYIAESGDQAAGTSPVRFSCLSYLQCGTHTLYIRESGTEDQDTKQPPLLIPRLGLGSRPSNETPIKAGSVAS